MEILSSLSVQDFSEALLEVSLDSQRAVVWRISRGVTHIVFVDVKLCRVEHSQMYAQHEEWEMLQASGLALGQTSVALCHRVDFGDKSLVIMDTRRGQQGRLLWQGYGSSVVCDRRGRFFAASTGPGLKVLDGRTGAALARFTVQESVSHSLLRHSAYSWIITWWPDGLGLSAKAVNFRDSDDDDQSTWGGCLFLALSFPGGEVHAGSLTF